MDVRGGDEVAAVARRLADDVLAEGQAVAGGRREALGIGGDGLDDLNFIVPSDVRVTPRPAARHRSRNSPYVAAPSRAPSAMSRMSRVYSFLVVMYDLVKMEKSKAANVTTGLYHESDDGNAGFGGSPSG